MRVEQERIDEEKKRLADEIASVERTKLQMALEQEKIQSEREKLKV